MTDGVVLIYSPFALASIAWVEVELASVLGVRRTASFSVLVPFLCFIWVEYKSVLL